MAFELPELPFDPNGFEGWTSAETFTFHHGKHHAGYVNKLNGALEDSDLAGKDLLEIINATRGTTPKIFNLAAQHFNHSFFWNCLQSESAAPEGQIAELIERDLGGMDAFKKMFSDVALKHFGSGWAWLVQEPGGKLLVIDSHDANTPAGTETTPLLTLDVWEHAYYIDFRNDRSAFIDGFWKHVNWKHVNEQLSS
jgi:Fe-Mn family superoxide dismutase